MLRKENSEQRDESVTVEKKVSMPSGHSKELIEEEPGVNDAY